MQKNLPTSCGVFRGAKPEFEVKILIQNGGSASKTKMANDVIFSCTEKNLFVKFLSKPKNVCFQIKWKKKFFLYAFFITQWGPFSLDLYCAKKRCITDKINKKHNSCYPKSLTNQKSFLWKLRNRVMLEQERLYLSQLSHPCCRTSPAIKSTLSWYKTINSKPIYKSLDIRLI